MRSRKEIEKQADNCGGENRIIIELLLDIRDMIAGVCREYARPGKSRDEMVELEEEAAKDGND